MAQPGTRLGVVAGFSLEGRHWKACEKSEDVLSGLPEWEKSMFGG